MSAAHRKFGDQILEETEIQLDIPLKRGEIFSRPSWEHWAIAVLFGASWSNAILLFFK